MRLRICLVRCAGACGLVTAILWGLVGSSVGPAGAAASPSSGPLAGYQAGVPLSTLAVSSVVGTVVLPTFTCTRSEHLLILLSASSSTGVTGEAGVDLGCSRDNRPTLRPVAYTPVAAKFAPGDRVKLSILCDGRGVTSVVQDMTSGKDYSDTVAGASVCNGFIVGDFNLVGVGLRLHPGPIPRFKTIRFSHVRANGGPLSATSPIASNYSAGPGQQILTGPLTGGGTAFVTTRG